MAVRSGDGVGEEFRRGREEARQLGGEFGDIANDARYLFQKEAELARAEIQQSVRFTVQSIIMGVVAAVFAAVFLVFAFVTVMFAFDTFLVPWAAALATTGIIFVITLAVLGLAYARMKQVSFAPQRTMRSLREDMEWLKTQMQSTAK